MIGDKMIYRSMYSGEYNAVVRAIRFAHMAEECFDLDVFSDSGKLMLHVTRIEISDHHTKGIATIYFGERPLRA